ncbi:disease resistance protein RUN1-like isoform X1 [Cryptomeria japonica]|uniref:disease resistance protein RUN1-like isoform X1 n=1 Tax=Cryptomeria japonica TaxID=3369 RepID=UPI0027DAB385|nr:disease resistance protein RUN1-like isoform X1 [Cryptomeria japonica]
MLFLENVLQAPLQLRQLLISHCLKFQGFPKSIGQLNHLKKIVITEGYSVRSLPDEFCLLQSLEQLVLFECKLLSSLPSNFGDLSNLRHLNLSCCEELRRLPDTFKNLKLLEHLDLANCHKLTFKSEDLNFLENITKLDYLNLSFIRQLQELPRHVTNQASLRELYFDYTSLRDLPDSIGQLSRITKMRIVCVQLSSLPTSLGDLSSLTKLEIAYSPKLKSLPKSIRQLNNLQELSITNIPISELDFGTASLSNLKKISLEGTVVCKLSFSEACYPHLESLHVSYNRHLEEIEALSRTLKSIYLGNCEMLKNIPSFAGFTSLRNFCLTDCCGIEKIEGLENCTILSELSVETCWELPGIKSLEHLQNLKRLALKANKRSVIERCIQTIQKWPNERIIIWAQAVPDAASLVHSFLSQKLMIVDSSSNQGTNSSQKLVLKGIPDGDAIMFCCVINCVSSQMTLEIVLDGRILFFKKVGKGRWALVGVLSQRNSDGELRIQTLFGEGEVEKGLVVRGEEQTTREALRSLLPLFSL